MHHLPRRLLVAPVLAAGLLTVVLAAQPVFLAAQPVEQPLPRGLVSIELDNAAVQVEMTAEEGASRLRLRPPAPEVEVEELVEVFRLQDGAAIRRKPVEGTAPLPRLRLELTLAPEQRLRVVGADLEVVVQHAETVPIPAAAEETTPLSQLAANEKAPPEPQLVPEGGEEGLAVVPLAVLDVNVERSQVAVLGGTTPAILLGTTSSFRVEGSARALTFDLVDGVAEVLRHRGPLTCRGEGAEFTINDLEGPLEIDLLDGSATVRSGRGLATVEATGALAVFDGWQGRLTLHGVETVVETRGRDQGSIHLELEGERLDVLAEQIRGIVSARLRGGSLRGNGWMGRSDITASDRAEVDLSNERGTITLRLEDGARGRFTDVEGRLSVHLEQASLEADGILDLDLTALDADIVARRIRSVTKIDLSHSELDLDMSGARGRPTLELRDGSRATARLSPPCRVQVQGAGVELGNLATVSGCELLLHGQRRASFAARGVDGEGLVVLTATLAEDTELTVEGVP